MWELQVFIDDEWQPVTVNVNKYTFPLHYDCHQDAEQMVERLFPADSQVRARVVRAVAG